MFRASDPIDTRPIVNQSNNAANTDEETRSVTFEDLGIPRTVNLRSTFFGNVRTFQSLSMSEWILLVAGLSFFISTIILAIDRFFVLQPGSRDYVFDVLLIYNAVFSIMYILHGIFREQAFELLALSLSSLTLILYVVVHYVEEGGPSADAFKLARLIITCTLGIPTGFLGLYIGYEYFSSRRLIFITVGADISTQKMCLILFTTTTLILFNLQMTGSVVILSLKHGFGSLNLQELLTIVIGTPWLLIWSIMTYASVRKESSSLYISCQLLSPLQIGYVGFAIAQTALHGDGGVIAVCRYLNGATAVFIQLLLNGFLFMCFRNFGRGLRERVYPSASNTSSS